jgi:hypothetical protein
MTSNHAQTSRAPREPRNRRRLLEGRPAWFRPFCRMHRALDASARLIDSTLRTMARSERCAQRRPVQASVTLHEASARLLDASRRLVHAAEQLAAANDCIALEPERATLAPELLAHATERWVAVATHLQQASDDVFAFQQGVLLGLETGVLVPERPAEDRPRIRLAPRPVPIRAFLRLRQARVTQRIAPLLRRRRRTPRPAAVRVPKRNLLGRAPPLSSISLL